MKKLIALCLALVMALGLMAGCGDKSSGGQEDSSQKTYKFTVSSFYAAVNRHGALTQAWIDEVQERSGGRLQFTYFPSNALVSAANSYSAVVDGSCDIAMTATANTPGVFQASSLAELPQGYPNGYVGSRVYNDLVQEYDLDEFSDVKVLLAHAVSPLVVLTTKETRTVDDFNGQIIRAGSALATDTAKALKAEPYSCQISELYEAMVKKIVDGAITGKDALQGFKLNEVTKYIVEDPSYGKTGAVVMVMNQNKFNALPEDLQQIITDVSAEFSEYHARAWRVEDITADQEFIALGEGREIIKFSAEDSAKLAETLKPVNEAYIESLDKLTAEQVEEYQNYIQERIAYWSAEAPSDEEILEWNETYLKPILE